MVLKNVKFVLLLLQFAQTAAQSDSWWWTGFNGANDHSGFKTDRTIDDPAKTINGAWLIWANNIARGGAWYSNPVIAENSLFIVANFNPTYTSILYKIGLQTGNIEQQVTLANEFAASLTYGKGGSLYSLGIDLKYPYNGSLTCYNAAENLTISWNATFDNGNNNVYISQYGVATSRKNKLVYVQGGANMSTFLAFDMKNGDPVFETNLLNKASFKIGSASWVPTVTPMDDRVFFVNSQSTPASTIIGEVQNRTGKLMWQREFVSSTRVSKALNVVDGTAFIFMSPINSNTSLVAIDTNQATAPIIWSNSYCSHWNQPTDVSPVVDDTFIYVPCASNIQAFNIRSGMMEQLYQGCPGCYQLLVTKKYLFGSSSSAIYGYDKLSGSSLLYIPVDNVVNRFVYFNGTLFVSTYYGLMAFVLQLRNN